MTEAELKIEARLFALETLLARVIAAQMLPLSDGQFDSAISSWERGVEGLTFAHLPPEQSDMWAEEIGHALRDTLQTVRRLRTLKK